MTTNETKGGATDNTDKNMRETDHVPTPSISATASSLSEEESAGLLSRLTFAWMRPLFRQATALRKDRSKMLQSEDLLRLPQSDFGHVIYRDFQHAWEQNDDAAGSPPADRIVAAERVRPLLVASAVRQAASSAVNAAYGNADSGSIASVMATTMRVTWITCIGIR